MTGQWVIIQAAGQSLGVELSPIELRDADGIQRDVAKFDRGSSGGLVVAVSTLSQLHREVIVRLAARHQLPTIYPYRFFVSGGGLISYGPDLISLYRLAATYGGRVLRSLPVQTPTKYELAVTLKTARRPHRARVVGESG